jgi:hypothetical protein
VPGGDAADDRLVDAANTPPYGADGARLGGHMSMGSKVFEGAAALGLAALSVGPSASPASAQERTGVARCRQDGGSELLSVAFSGLPGIQVLSGFAFIRYRDGTTEVFQQLNVTPDETGFAVMEVATLPSAALPMDLGVAVYRDTSQNSRWDPDRDENFYRGDGSVATCPSDVTLASK